MARPRSEEKVIALLTAAKQCIAERGTGASTAMIAKLAGVSEGTLFRYFPSKEDLLNEVYLYLKKDMCAFLSEGFIHSAELEERARFLWTSYINWGLRDPAANTALSHLDICEQIHPETHHKAFEYFPDLGVDEAFVSSPIFSGLKRDFADTIFGSLAAATIKFATAHPENANAYKKAGFAAFWKIIG